MATVLDSLIIRLDLDGSGMAKGAQEAHESLETLHKGTQQAGDGAQKAGQAGADAFAAFRREAVGALALFTGGKSLSGFTEDITEANAALGTLSQQLGIAPQKIAQMRHAVHSKGGNESSVDALFSSLHAQGTTHNERARINNHAARFGVEVFDQKGHIQDTLLDQMAHSKRFQAQSRPVQEDFIRQLNGTTDITKLVTAKDYDKTMNTYAQTGPTQPHIERTQQLRHDWTQLQAEAPPAKKAGLGTLDPTLHAVSNALSALEKAHPDTVARGVDAVSSALTRLSATLTARGFMASLTPRAGHPTGKSPSAHTPTRPRTGRERAAGRAHDASLNAADGATGADETQRRSPAPPIDATPRPTRARANAPGAPTRSHRTNDPLKTTPPTRDPKRLDNAATPHTWHNAPPHPSTQAANTHASAAAHGAASPPHNAGTERSLSALSTRMMAAIKHGTMRPDQSQALYSGMVERMAGLSHAASSAPTHSTTHTTNTTTHAPTVNITVHGSENPHDTAHIIDRKLAESLYAGNLHQVI